MKSRTHAELRNIDWSIWMQDNGACAQDQVVLVLLMDIRHELQRLNNVLQCPNFIAVPSKLDAIVRNTTPKRRRRRAKR